MVVLPVARGVWPAWSPLPNPSCLSSLPGRWWASSPGWVWQELLYGGPRLSRAWPWQLCGALRPALTGAVHQRLGTQPVLG